MSCDPMGRKSCYGGRVCKQERILGRALYWYVETAYVRHDVLRPPLQELKAAKRVKVHGVVNHGVLWTR